MTVKLLVSTCAIALIAYPAGSGAAGARRHAVAMTWTVKTPTKTAGTTARDEDRTSGDPFGSGAVSIVTRQSPNPLHSTFTIKTAHGTVSGKLVTTIRPVGPTGGPTMTLRYSGTGRFTSGTGSYAGASGSISRLTGEIRSTTTCPTPTSPNCTHEENGRLVVRGTVRY